MLLILAIVIAHFFRFTPNHEYITFIISFESIVIALLIPLSIDIISRIDSKYSSNIISKSFFNRNNKNIYFALILFIAAIITFVFFSNSTINKNIILIADYLILELFLSSICFLFFLLRQIMIFTSESLLLNHFEKMIQTEINSKRMIYGQEIFINNLEGIADILVFNTKKRWRNKLVEKHLEELNKIIKNFFDLFKSNPNKFIELLISKKYRKNKENTEFILSIIPDEVLIGYSAILNAIFSIYEASIAVNNFDIRAKTKNMISKIYIIISNNGLNDIFIRQQGKNITEIYILNSNLPNKRDIISDFLEIFKNIIFSNFTGVIENKYIDSVIKIVYDISKYAIDNLSNSEFEYIMPEYLEIIFTTKNDKNDKSDKIRRLEKYKELIFMIGCYALFRKKYKFIKELWNYEQPDDSDATWLNNKIIPTNIEDVLYLLSIEDKLKEKFRFWKNRHGETTYIREYIILLLMNVLKNIKIDTIETYNLKYSEKGEVLYDIINKIDRYIYLSKEIECNMELLQELGFNTNNKFIEELFEHKLILLLNKIRISASKNLDKIELNKEIEDNKISEFKNLFKSEYEKFDQIKGIFLPLCLYKQKKIKNYIKTINMIKSFPYDKSAFFDEWYKNYQSLTERLARNYAINKTVILIEQIAQVCEKISMNDLDKTLNQIGKDNIFLLTNDIRLICHSNRFLFNYSPHNYIAGYYKVNNYEIPIYEFGNRDTKSTTIITILNKKKFGTIIQYSPEEKESLGIFDINIRFFYKEKNLINEFLNHPPDWLKKIPENERENSLKRKALIEIRDKVEFKKSKNFEGYVIEK